MVIRSSEGQSVQTSLGARIPIASLIQTLAIEPQRRAICWNSPVTWGGRFRRTDSAQISQQLPDQSKVPSVR